MNRIEKLITELCPKGVEYKKLGEVCKTLKKGTLTVGELILNGKYPVINSGREFYGFYDKYNNEGNAITIAARGEYAGFINYIKEKFWAGGLCYPYTSIDETQFLTKFIYYALKVQENYIRSKLVMQGSIPALNKTDIDKLTIPIPPLPIQEEIVKILDTFTELERELERELEARKKQYEYYRNKLLTPIEVNGKWLLNGKPVEWKKLGEVVLQTENIKWKETNKTYFYIDLTSVNRETHKITEIIEINKENAPSRAQKIVLKNDIIFATTRPTLMRFAIIDDKYNNQIASTGYCILRANKKYILPKWIYYNISKSEFKNYLEKNQEGAAYPSISDNKIKNFPIPIPPLSEQERIVAILDKFDALVNDISQGLPAEIEARRKQYEYYRNKLLTFKEKR